ncbi:MAG: type II secretion system F family protein [Planctomycetota bacterium]|nr:type II secretion system F family protein [Planctomycetota bacterium]MCB9902268.1 type II secretion system F family protein [Planctomycetota bacterium]
MPKIPASQGGKSSGRSGAPRGGGGGTATAAPRTKPIGKARVSRKALTQFTSQLSTLQDAGLPIVRSLKILGGQMERGPFKSVVVDVTDEVESGSPLSEAMSRHPGVFDGLYTNMVKAGEAGGVLDVILARLSGFMEKAERLKKKIKGAMVYPVVVGSVTVAILLLIMVFVVPKFEEVFKSLPGIGELPPLTQFLQAFSRFLLDRWYIVLVILLLLFGAIKGIGMTRGGRRFYDRVKLRLPIIGTLVRKVVVARFSRTFGTLISSGVPILEALDICRNTAGNTVLEDALDKVRESITEGGTIAEPLGESGIFDDIIVNMVDVGEETGELDKMLIRVADNYDEEVDIAVGSLVSIIEPLLIVFLGGAVFLIVLGLFLPLLKLIQSVDQRAG